MRSSFKIGTVVLSACLVFASLGAKESSAQSSRMYLAGYMGLNAPFEQNFSDNADTTATMTSGDIKFKNTVSFAGALGLRLSTNVRVEAELSYKDNDADTIDFNNAGLNSEELSGSLKNFNGLVNLYYDFNVPWKVKPYVGAGLGLGWFEGDITSASGPNFSEDATGLIWNAAAGLKYRTRSNVAFTAGYRYLDSADLDFEGVDLEYSDHEFRIGIEYDLE